MQPQIIADHQCHNAEGPLWHPIEQRLYWTDIPRGRLYRYDPSSNTSECIYETTSIGGYTFQEDGSLLLFKEQGKIETWRDGEVKVLIDEIPAERDGRFNDVIADPAGRVFCGTMPTSNHPGRLYRLDTDGTLTTVLDRVGVSNGLGFTPDLKQIYYTDSTALTIYLFDYDQATGELSNQRTYLTTPRGEGVPDGMTVDAEGLVWSARWDGHHLFRYDTNGQELLRIELPAKKVSCVTFGGPDYTDIYISTAGGDHRGEEGPGAGAVFRLNLGIKGRPEFFSKVKV